MNEYGGKKRKTVYGKNKEEVANKLSKLKLESKPPKKVESLKSKTLGPAMKDWLLLFKKASVSPRTFETNMINFNNQILPNIGTVRISDVKLNTIQQLMSNLTEQGFNNNTLRKTKFLLNQFFNYCVENNIVDENPISKVRVYSRANSQLNEKSDYKALPFEIREKFIQSLNDNQILKPFSLTLLFAGLRPGEALGLSWYNLDFTNNIIHVEKSVTIVPKFDKNGKVISRKPVLSSTKTTNSVRKVPMPKLLKKALMEWKEIMSTVYLKDGTCLTDSKKLVFSNRNGEPKCYSGLRSIFAEFLKKHDLEKYNISFHRLRHTYATMLFESGENPKVIQGLLGHRNVTTTLSTYTSVDSTHYAKAVERLESFYDDNLKQNNKIIHKLKEDALDKIGSDLDVLLKVVKELKELDAESQKPKKQDFEQE